MTPKEIELTFSESGRVFLFRLPQVLGSENDGDMNFGDFAAHDLFPLPECRITAPVVEVGATGRIKIYTKNGHCFCFLCAVPGTVLDNEQAVTKFNGESVVGSTAYERAEWLIEKIYNVLNYDI